jgi:DNA repair exonuclease SbcCD ATPase subunit
LTDTGFEFIEGLDQDINFNGYNTIEESGMVDYRTVQKELKQGLISFQNSTLTDKAMNDRVKTILATVENTSTITPATQQIQEVENAAQGIIQKQIEKNKERQKEVEDYDNFIEKLKSDDVVLVDDDTISAKLTTPLLTIDTHTQNILQSQEDPTKTYLNLNKKMVEGYLYAINTDGPEKLNMTQSTYNKSKKYL